MPAAIAIPLALGAGTAAAGVIGAKLQSGASRDAANAQVTAANHAADLQSQAAAQALAFQKQQAAQDQQNYVNTQLANYGQYANRQQQIGSVGELLGLAPRNVPPPPSFLTGQQTTPTSGTTVAGVDPKIQSFIAQYQQNNPASAGIGPLAEAVAKAFPGVTRYDYSGTPSDNELNINGTKFKVIAGTGTNQSWYVPGTNDSGGGATMRAPVAAAAPMSTLFAPYAANSPLTPALMAPQIRG